MTYDRNKDEHALREALTARGLRVVGKTAQCPWHDDQTPSASLIEGEGGVWRIYCHVCDKAGDWYDITGEKPDSRPVPASSSHDRRETASGDHPRRFPSIDAIRDAYRGAEGFYEYEVPATGRVELMVVRYRRRDGKKAFAQHSPSGDGWIDRAGPKPWPLYQLADVIRSEAVVLVEGEKAADALRAIGIPATTTPCGAGKAEHCDLLPLQGKRICLWPDHDENGAKHMDDVAMRLAALPVPPQVRRIDPARLAVPMPPKGDAVEFLAAFGGDKAAVVAALRAADPIGPEIEIQRRLAAQMDGMHCAIPLPWPALSNASEALLPGTVTIVCGSPGAAKSFWLLQAMAGIHRDGVRVAILELEESREYHLQRALAQMSGIGDLTTPRWVRANPTATRGALAEHGQSLGRFGRCIWAQGNITIADVAAWIEERARAGVRVIAVDPITLADPGTDRAWMADRTFMARVKPVIEKTGASLILVTHPRKAAGMAKAGPPTLDDLAGGTAYQRAAQCVLWLQSVKDTDSLRANVEGFGLQTVKAHKVVAVLKARNAAGMGRRVAFTFTGKDLRFSELGLVVDE